MAFATEEEELDQSKAATHRLTEITANEVSLVDRAANQRKFLLIKRANMGKQLASDGSGGFVSGEGETVEKGTDATSDSSGAGDSSNTDTDAKKDDDAETAKGDDVEAKAKDDDAKGDTEAAKGDDVEAKDDDAKGDTEADVEAKAKDDDAETAKGDDVEKAGAGMKRARLERFKGAMKTLQELLSELDGDPMGKADAADDAADAKVTKAEETAANMAAQIEELQSVVKSQADKISQAQTEIEKLRGSAGESNTIPVGDVSKNADQEIDWPFDLNRPLGKDQVETNKSFHND